jgi:hypothetical protein
VNAQQENIHGRGNLDKVASFFGERRPEDLQLHDVIKDKSKQSGNQAIRQSGNQAIRQSGNQAIRQSGNQAIRQSGNQAVRQSGNGDFSIDPQHNRDLQA